MSVLNSNLFRQKAYINGEWLTADKGRSFDVFNPSTGKVIGTVPEMGKPETRHAIKSAQLAGAGWSGKTARERHAILMRWFRLIMENRELMSELITWEQGKPLTEARVEITHGASFIEWFAEEAKRIYGEIIPEHQADKRLFVMKQPLGVVGAITPWNFPNAMITRKAGAALAAGCTMVLKPSEQTPFSALALAVLAEKAGMPKGVFNVVTGAASEIGQELTASDIVRGITFTGSTRVGSLLMAQSAPTVKKLGLELGGNAPFIVFEDADLDEAVEGVLGCKFRNNGQTCVCANRIYVQEGIYDLYTEKLNQAVKGMKVGDGMEEGVSLGPLINHGSVSKMEKYIEDALEKGASLVCGGKAHSRGGLFFEPTILTGMTSDMLAAREEIFGPLAPLYSFRDETDLIEQANATSFGLASYLYTNDLRRIYRIVEALEYGIVGVNTGVTSTEIAPFGGIKSSGLGREGSRHGLEEYLELKYLCMGGMN